MIMPDRKYQATAYRFGFNGKENDNEVKGFGNEQDYGLRIFDPRLGKFLSIDPLSGKFPFFSPYQFAGNTPIRFTDLDGAETYDNSAKYWSGQPLIDMTNAPAKGTNAAGVPRNAIWFFKQQLAAKPEMFSEENKMNIAQGKNPVVDETWIKFNPSAAAYEDQVLWHHHIDGGKMAAAIPRGLNNDNFSELHPYVNAGKELRGTRISGLLGGTLNTLGTIGMFSGLFTGDPDSWINAFGYGEPHVGDIKKDWGNTNLYVQIMSIIEHYIPVTDKNGKQVIDPKTGKPQYRLGSKTVTANGYSGYIYNEETKKFEGVNKVSTVTEEWKYDENGDRIQPEKRRFDTGASPISS
jgi:RHS repeat-associated protein